MATDNPLQRYQIMEPLGSGGQGHTFRAIDRDTNRTVAVKVLSIKGMRDWKAFDLFEREAKVLGGLSHPGIPRYIDSYGSEATGDYFLVMEMVEGRTLRSFVGSEQRLDPERLRDILEQTLSILEYLHGLRPPVIHRDIKPANLILRPGGSVALVDFGGVRRALGGEGGATTVGTFGYMAPEQLYGEARPASDLYALGATMAALCGGMHAEQLPHDGLRIDLAQLDVPAELLPALQGMLEPEPDKRLPSVAAVRAALAASATRKTKAGGTGQRRSTAKGRSTDPSRALARIHPTAKVLAKTPAPFSVLVWIAAALSSGCLLVVEAVLFPVFYQILSGFYSRDDRPRRQEFERDMDDFRQRVRTARKTTAFVAGKTRPSTD